MHPVVRTCALAAALLGGICWVTHLFVDVATLGWAGAVLLGLALALLGSGLSRLPAVAAVAALGAVGLGWSLLELVRDLGESRTVDAVVGALATLAVAAAVLLPGSAPQQPPDRGRAHRQDSSSRGNHRA